MPDLVIKRAKFQWTEKKHNGKEMSLGVITFKYTLGIEYGKSEHSQWPHLSYKMNIQMAW